MWCSLSRNVRMWAVLYGPRWAWRWRTPICVIAAHIVMLPPRWPGTSMMALWLIMFLPLLLVFHVWWHQHPFPVLSENKNYSNINQSGLDKYKKMMCYVWITESLVYYSTLVNVVLTSAYWCLRSFTLSAFLSKGTLYSCFIWTWLRWRTRTKADLPDVVENVVVPYDVVSDLSKCDGIVCQNQVCNCCFLCLIENP